VLGLAPHPRKDRDSKLLGDEMLAQGCCYGEPAKQQHDGLQEQGSQADKHARRAA
jgi:hypothetical protein